MNEDKVIHILSTDEKVKVERIILLKLMFRTEISRIRSTGLKSRSRQRNLIMYD